MSTAAYRKKLITYLDKIPEGEYVIKEEQFESLPYYICVETAKRHLTVSINDSKEVELSYRMIRGQGSKADFEKCVNVMRLFTEHHKKKLKGFALYKTDFDKMVYKVCNDDIIRTLLLDPKTNEINYSDRKRKAKEVTKDLRSSKEVPKKTKATKEAPVPVIIEDSSKEALKRPDKKLEELATPIIKPVKTEPIERVPKEQTPHNKAHFKPGDEVELINDSSWRFKVVNVDSKGLFLRAVKDGGIYGLATCDLKLVNQ